MKEKTNVKELLDTSVGTEGSLLIPSTIHARLIEEHQKSLIGRQYAAMVVGPMEVKGSSYNINRATVDSMSVFQVAEGGEVPIDQSAYTNLSITPLKYGVRPVITREMIEDSQFSLIEHNMRLSGKKLAENETKLILAQLDNANSTVAGGAAVTIANITRAMQYLEDADYNPRVYAVGPEVANDLRNIDTFAEADKFGTREMQANGFIGRLYGMDVIRFPSTNSIGTSTNSYVFDPEFGFVVVEKRPLTTEVYKDEIHDLQGAVVTQRIAVGLLRTKAVAKITSS